MFLDKNKLQMSIDIEKDTYQPGETIRGTFRVRVLKEVTVTALRLHVYAKEKAQIAVSSGGSSRDKAEDEYTHLEKLFTFFGYSKESGRKGGATLAPTPEDEEGLQYPFEVYLPPTTAPSFSFQFKKDGEVGLTYKLRGLCVIDKGFDGKVDKYIRVVTATPQEQYASTRDLMHGMKPERIALPPESCVCFKKDVDPAVTVELACPQLIVFDEDNGIKSGAVDKQTGANQASADPNQPLPDTPAPAQGTRYGQGTDAQPSAFLPVTLKITNNSSKKTIKSVAITLSQFRQISCKGLSKAEVTPIASLLHSPPNGGLGPRRSYSATVQLDLGSRLSMFGFKGERKSIVSGGVVMPTMATQFVEISNMLEVKVPLSGAGEPVTMADACWFVSVVDQKGRTPPTPVRFNTNVILPEEIVGGAMQ